MDAFCFCDPKNRKHQQSMRNSRYCLEGARKISKMADLSAILMLFRSPAEMPV